MAKDMGFDGALAELERDAEEQERIEQERRAKDKYKQHIDEWDKRIKWARDHDKEYHKRWADDRRVAAGDFDKENYEVSVNLIAVVTEIIASYLYARNPQQITRPSESVGRDRLNDYKMFAKTLEIIVARLLKNAGLKRKAKRWIRGAMTTGSGWMKVAMQTRIESDPIMEATINDLQDQLGNIRAIKAEMKEGDEDQEVLEARLEAQLKATEAQLELVIAEGLVMDYMNPEDVTIAPECGEIENYIEAPWQCLDNYKTKEEVLKITGWESEDDLEYLKKANLYARRPRKGEPNEQATPYVQINNETDPEAETDKRGFYLIREIWSLDDGVVYTMLDGCKEKWAREPYAPITGRRYYPTFLLQFHPVDGSRYGQSDVHQLKGLQAEYNETRSDLRKHRRRAIPGIVFDKTAITEESINALTRSTTQEYVGIETIEIGANIQSILFPKVYNQIDPALYDTSTINREFEKLSGAQEALQQSVQVAKTATEARIQQEGFGARTGSRRDELEDVLTDLSEYVAQLALKLFDQADAEKYAGPNAVWMNLTNEQVMYMFDFEIKASSTGKPQAQKDRESWATLMPLIEGIIQKVGAARLAGQEWAARPWIALLAETLDRLDDHADIEDFLPQPPEQQGPQQEDNSEQIKTASEVKLNEAKTIETLAAAIQKEPEVARLPIVRELFGMGGEAPAPQPTQAEPPTETLASVA